MIVLAAALAFLGVLLAAWSYLVYPVWIARRSRSADEGSDPSVEPGSLEVVLSAADEEDVIAGRVENLLAQETAIPFRVSIGCDGCRDRTAGAARDGLGNRGRVVEFPERRGKARERSRSCPAPSAIPPSGRSAGDSFWETPRAAARPRRFSGIGRRARRRRRGAWGSASAPTARCTRRGEPGSSLSPRDRPWTIF
jgi:hypothetical protein